MTPNKIAIVTVVVLLGSMLGVLSLGNPQWKWCYLFQNYVLSRLELDNETNTNELLIFVQGDGPEIGRIHKPPGKFVGLWKDWDPKGNIIRILQVSADKTELIFCVLPEVDRRKEFGILIE